MRFGVRYAIERVRPRSADAVSEVSPLLLIRWAWFRASTAMFRGFLTRAFYKSVSGPLLFVGKNTRIFGRECVEVGRAVSIGDNSFLHLYSTGVHIGDHVTIREYAWIQLSSDPIRLGGPLLIGPNTYIGPRSYMGGGRLAIGRDCQIGGNFTAIAENHVGSPTARSEADVALEAITRRGITIGDRCWIGNSVVVLDGVHIGDDVVVGAGSIVTRDVAPNSTVVGNPARPIASRRPRGDGS